LAKDQRKAKKARAEELKVEETNRKKPCDQFDIFYF